MVNRTEFEIEQYRTLREEIRETKARIFYISAAALFVVPGGQYIARTMDAPLVVAVLPLLVLCIAFLYLSENHSLMRCGRYIRLQIEAPIPDFMGWEEWLESPDGCEPRKVDSYVNYSFLLLFTVYYVASSLAAVRSAAQTPEPWVYSAAIGGYSAIGAFFALFLLRTVKSATTTAGDVRVPTKKPVF